MSIKVHCDGPDCNNSTREETASFGWVRVEAMTETTIMSRETKTRHYCSAKCEHAHTYLLMSGDNGK